jgi:hypothetical protein
MLSLSHDGEKDNVFPCPDPQCIDWVPAAAAAATAAGYSSDATP